MQRFVSLRIRRLCGASFGFFALSTHSALADDDAYRQSACFSPPVHSSKVIESSELTAAQSELIGHGLDDITVSGVEGRTLKITDPRFLDFKQNQSYHLVGGKSDYLRSTWKAIYAKAHPQEIDPITMVVVGVGLPGKDRMFIISDSRCM
jgi:hypothetical protein